MNQTTSTSAQPTTRVLPRLLPFEPLDALAARSRRLADLVESISRRRDVRELRARLLVLLLELRCPVGARPRKPWYVPGAVARLGVEGLRRAWRAYHGGEPPCARTLRAHLGLLERVRAVGRQPGDWVDGELPAEGAWRPRHADTIHVLEDEAAAEAWGARVAPALAAHRDLRRNPDRWRRLVGRWRGPIGRQLDLFDPAGRPAGSPEGLPDRVGEDRPAGEALARRLASLAQARSQEVLDVLAAARDAGAHLRGRASFELAADRRRAFGAAALLARALARGDWVRNRAAWLVRAFRLAGAGELDRAAAWAAGYGSDPRKGRPK